MLNTTGLQKPVQMLMLQLLVSNNISRLVTAGWQSTSGYRHSEVPVLARLRPVLASSRLACHGKHYR